MACTVFPGCGDKERELVKTETFNSLSADFFHNQFFRKHLSGIQQGW